MANPLTGDFEAVLQISGSTINRLVATMHQNAFTKPNLPSFPHVIRMRIGDGHAIDGVRGLVFGQISVPRIHLIHGVTDRFELAVGVRAWYRPDPSTKPLPTYINGTVRAEYRVQDIDPHCLGWSKHASDYLWIRVVKDSVNFQGTGEDDINPLAVISPADPAVEAAANIAKITRQIAGQLATRFEATPHPVSKRFRRGSLRSLNSPIGGSAVALPIGLSGEPAGDINSINNPLLEGSDLAVGVNLDYIMSLTAPMVNSVQNFKPTFWIHIATGKYNPIPDFDTVYHVGVHPPKVEWEPHGSYAVFKISVSGWATTESIAPNVTFEIIQNITLSFNAGDGRLHLTPSTPVVTPHASGLAGGFVEGTAHNEILKAVIPIVQAACNNAQPALDVMTTRTPELVQQLQTLDDQADVGLDEALFLRDGIILRGTIYLTGRRALVVKTSKTAAGDAHTALDSWIPGGRIDRFEWSWTWAQDGDPGHTSLSDRFLLRRPHGIKGRWGAEIGGATSPLPGLDGWGFVCLKISGVRVDSVTGEFVPVSSALKCTRFGFSLSELVQKDKRLFLRDMPELSKEVPFPQLALVSPRRGVAAANTLLLYVDRAWDPEVAETLEKGLEASRRYDAGLALLILFREGILESAGPGLIKQVMAVTRKIGITALVNEDVHGDWTRALALKAGAGELGWAIITPEGAQAWTHQGRISAEELGSALDTHLRRSAEAKPVEYQIAGEVGSQLAAAALYPGLGDLIVEQEESHCPPPPFGRLGVKGAVVTFVQKESHASTEKLRALVNQHGGREGEKGAVIVAVIDGANAREAQALKERLQLDFVPIPDQSGTIANRFRISVWPTTVTLNQAGVISAIESGVSARPTKTYDEAAV